MAYGAGGRDPNIKPEDVHKTFSDLIEGDAKITQQWDPYGDLGFGDDRPEGFCKVLMGTMMLAMEALPKGGKISIEPGSSSTNICAEGEDAMVREQVNEALARTISTRNLDPRLVHPYAISLLANSYNFTIKITSVESNRVVYTLGYHGE
jgi:histidine phosphotransferase ChpT